MYYCTITILYPSTWRIYCVFLRYCYLFEDFTVVLFMFRFSFTIFAYICVTRGQLSMKIRNTALLEGGGDGDFLLIFKGIFNWKTNFSLPNLNLIFCNWNLRVKYLGDLSKNDKKGHLFYSNYLNSFAVYTLSAGGRGGIHPWLTLNFPKNCWTMVWTVHELYVDKHLQLLICLLLPSTFIDSFFSINKSN